MIPVFFCHICDEKDNCRFAIRIAEKLRKDITGVEPFIACQDDNWNNAKELNTALNHCYLFIAIVSSGFLQKNNCVSELEQARERNQKNGKFPIIFPIQYQCDSKVMADLEFSIDQGKQTGERWVDFSNDSEYDVKYEEFYKRIYSTILDSNLITNEDFHKDCKVLDVVLREDEPTSGFVKTAIDYCRRGEEYGFYFFKNLSNPKWLSHLYAAGFFNNNPSPVESEKNAGYYNINIPFWTVLPYLEKVAENLRGRPTFVIIDIIRKVTRPVAPVKKQDNYHTWYSFIKIMANLPPDVIQLEDIDLVADWLESRFDVSLVMHEVGRTFLPKLLSTQGEDLRKVTRLIEIVINSIKVEKRHSVEVRGLQEMFELNASQLGEKCGKEIVEVLKRKIETVIAAEDDTYSYIWRPAIEDHEQNVGDGEYRHILIAGLRDVLLGFASKQDASGMIQTFFQSEKYIIRRIGLYVLDKLFEKFRYKELAEQAIQDEMRELLLKSNYHHEWYLFIKTHFNTLSKEVQKKLIEYISTLKGDWRDAADKERFNIELRRQWFGAIQSSGYQLPAEIKQRYREGINAESEHPEFLGYMGPVSWGDENVFSVSELLAQGSAENIISFLNGYRGKNRFGKPAIRESGQSLKAAVKAKQDFFEGNLDKFKEVKWEYWYYLLDAFEELWDDKKQIDWNKVLAFCSSIVHQDFLYQEEEKKDNHPLYPKESWVISVIADLIKKGVQNDERTMPDDCLDNAEQIIRIMLGKQKAEATGKEDSALNEAMNTTKGRVLTCFISYALRRYRTYERLPEKGIKEKESFWGKIEPLFDEEIKKTKEGNFEFSSIAGAYLPNLFYLNNDWAERNINHIFSQEEKHWRCAMAGYAYVSTVYSVIYGLLKKNGNLKRALDTEFTNDNVKERIVENIAVSYLRGQESLDGEGSLFKYLLEKWQVKNIEDTIDLFWAHRDVELNREQRDRIYGFLRYCFNRVKGHEEENKGILSDLNLLAVFLCEINNEQKDWLMQSVQHVEERYHSSFFLEYLDKLAAINPREAGEVFLEMLNKTVPPYKEENVTSIVEKIYKAGFKEIANLICDKYKRNGHDFLDDLYNRYNSANIK